jgi:hypothetical protein
MEDAVDDPQRMKSQVISLPKELGELWLCWWFAAETARDYESYPCIGGHHPLLLIQTQEPGLERL